MPEMSEYWQRLAAKLREGLDDDYEQGVDPIAMADLADEADVVPDPTPDPMPDLAPSPELLNIVAMARRNTRDIIDLSDDGWQLLIDETFFRIACALSRDGSIVLPNIGKIEIVWGEGGPYGRVTLDEAAKPEVLL
jgi:hypothetical protein